MNASLTLSIKPEHNYLYKGCCCIRLHFIVQVYLMKRPESLSPYNIVALEVVDRKQREGSLTSLFFNKVCLQVENNSC